MTRRSFLAVSAGALAFGAQRSRMGIAATSFLTARRPKDSLEFLEYCNSLGAGGAQVSLSSLDPAYIRNLRHRAESLGMYFEAMVSLPKDNSDAFEKSIVAAKEAGAIAVRTACLSGRRYETFATIDEWKTFVDRSRDAVIRAASVVEKQRVPLAIENHKDWTSEELSKMVGQISSEYVGVCLDTGNNVSLLEEPMAVVDALAPYALSTHLKDMAMTEIPDGFELSEVPFGKGMLNLKKVVETIRAKRPRTRITLEMITRNPLRVPCLLKKYWATFPDRSGFALAATLQAARSGKGPLPRIDGLDPAALLKLEESNVQLCLDYAGRELGL